MTARRRCLWAWRRRPTSRTPSSRPTATTARTWAAAAPCWRSWLVRACAFGTVLRHGLHTHWPAQYGGCVSSQLSSHLRGEHFLAGKCFEGRACAGPLCARGQLGAAPSAVGACGSWASGTRLGLVWRCRRATPSKMVTIGAAQRRAAGDRGGPARGAQSSWAARRARARAWAVACTCTSASTTSSAGRALSARRCPSARGSRSRTSTATTAASPTPCAPAYAMCARRCRPPL